MAGGVRVRIRLRQEPSHDEVVSDEHPPRQVARNDQSGDEDDLGRGCAGHRLDNLVQAEGVRHRPALLHTALS